MLSDDQLSIPFAGHNLIPDPSGALYLTAFATLLVSDLHLEKGTAFGASGIFIPPYDTKASLEQLRTVLDKYRPARLISLGDTFHDLRGADRLDATDAECLWELADRQETIWITGNHDPELPAELPGEVVSELTLGSLSLVHEPRQDCTNEIAGHLHPVGRMRRRGRSVRRKCFVVGNERIIMPAFGAYTGGLDLTNAAIADLFPAGGFTSWMLGKESVFPITAKTLQAA